MSYQAPVSREHPSCIFLLVDQSGSMEEEFAGDFTRTKAEGVAEAINRLLLELVISCVKSHDEGPRHYFDIGMIGYGATVGPLLGGDLVGRTLVSIVELADNPLAPDQPRWVEATAGGLTPMGQAIYEAGAAIADWANDHPDSFPPIVLNISDGAATDEEMVAKWVPQLKSLRTNDGELMFFNLNVARFEGAPILWPGADTELPNELARQLFEYSSVLPSAMLTRARRLDPSIPDDARGFAYNADFAALAQFLETGTQVDRST